MNPTALPPASAAGMSKALTFNMLADTGSLFQDSSRRVQHFFRDSSNIRLKPGKLSPGSSILPAPAAIQGSLWNLHGEQIACSSADRTQKAAAALKRKPLSSIPTGMEERGSNYSSVSSMNWRMSSRVSATALCQKPACCRFTPRCLSASSSTVMLPVSRRRST